MKLNLIDINALGYAAMYQPNLAKLAFNGQSTAALHGAVMSVLSLLKTYPEHVPVILWDGHARWRKELLPEYKSNRSDTEDKRQIRDAYRKQTPVIRQMLWLMGVPQVMCAHCEADDLAGWICRYLDPADEVILSTKDSDWWQALRDNVLWHSPVHKKTLCFADLSDPELMKEASFDSIEQYVCAKALAGDSSDCIPGIDGVGMKTAVKVLREHGSMEALWEKFDRGDKLTGKVLLKMAGPEFRESYQRNLQLIDWRRAPPIPGDITVISTTPELDAFELLCAEYGLTRMPAQARGMVMPSAKQQVVSQVTRLLDPAWGQDD